MTTKIQTIRKSKKLLFAATFATVAISLASCGTTDHKLKTASIPKFSKPISEMNAEELASASDRIGAAYAQDPSNRDAGLGYANLLRMTGKTDQALAVMQQVVIHHPKDQDVLAAYGKAQAAAGDLQAALSTISRAQTPDRPDWKLISAEGAILDQLGRPQEARAKYSEALDLAPNEPSILSNMGMSYLLVKDLRTAEVYLKRAAAQPGADSSVRQNLALVVGLQGRYQEAENIAKQELSPAQAEANIQYLRAMMSQQGSWKRLEKQG